MTFSQKRGFALLAVLWCVGIMTLTVMGLIIFVSQQLDENISHAKDFRAKQLAESGLALGLNDQVEVLDPLLKKDVSSFERFSVTIHSEDTRLNLNSLLQSGQIGVLTRLWQQWGLTPIEADALNDCLLDWIDPDDMKRLNGAERPQYAALGFPDFPGNHPFQSLNEVSHVIGFEKVVKLRPDWQNFFTLWSDGLLDLNEAPAELIAAALDLPIKQAEDFVASRSKLTREGSLTPYQFKSIDEARSLLGLTSDEFKKASGLFTIQSKLYRIVSQGTVDRHKHTIEVVTLRNGKTPIFYLWQEY